MILASLFKVGLRYDWRLSKGMIKVHDVVGIQKKGCKHIAKFIPYVHEAFTKTCFNDPIVQSINYTKNDT